MRPNGFGPWLTHQRERQDDVGTLARDLRSASGLFDASLRDWSHIRLRRYVNMMRFAQLAAFDQAVSEWCAWRQAPEQLVRKRG